jgi:hypothetical protein
VVVRRSLSPKLSGGEVGSYWHGPHGMTAGQPCPLIWSAPLDEHAARFPDAAAARGRANQGVQRQRGRGAGRLPPGEAGLMARQRDWHGRDLANMAADLVTISDIAVRAGSPPDAAESWTGLPGFPCPLVPASEGSRVWWWPDVRGFIVSHGDELDGYVPPPPVAGPPGKRGPTPGPRSLTAFDVRQIRAMRAQVDDLGRLRYTAAQIASTLPGRAGAALIQHYAPDRAPPWARRRSAGASARAS